MTVNRIDPTPVHISNSVTIAGQTSTKKAFGDRLNTNADTSGVVTNGGAVVGGALPGGAIVSAAVAQAGGKGGARGGGGAVGASYGATGVVTLGGGGGVNTTVGGGGATGGVAMGTTVGGGGVTSGTNFIPSTGDSTIGDMNQQLIQSQSENAEMMALQEQMQRENIVFTSVSNVLKTRQDTAKNTISNVH